MAKKKVTVVVEELLKDYLAAEGLELYHCEFAKEGGDWFLKVFIDYAPDEAEPRYIGTDECEKVSRYLSEQLDASDPIEQNYYLMVSSPGMDRPLLKPSHWRRYVGEQIEVRLYRGKDGTKNIAGRLDSYEEAEGDADGGQARITITDDAGKVWTLERSEIAKANLAVVF